MRRQAAVLVLTASIAFGGAAVAPSAAVDVGSPLSVERAEAAPAAGNVRRTGDKAAGLISDILVPVLFALIGAFALVALQKREFGPALVVVLGGVLAGFFLIDPDGAKGLFEGIYRSLV